MHITQRFRLLVKGHVNSVLDSLEDPERTLNQLVLDMEDELEAAKRAAAGAMANEERLRTEIRQYEKEAEHWQKAARRVLGKEDEATAREALERAERCERQAARLKEQLSHQASETLEVRESVAGMQRKLSEARQRLQVVQAQIRSAEARRAVSKVMRRVDHSSLGAEFDRVSLRAETEAASERAYQRLDAELSGDDLKRRLENTEVDDAVDDRLAALRREMDGEADDGAADALEAQEAEDASGGTES